MRVTPPALPATPVPASVPRDAPALSDSPAGDTSRTTSRSNPATPDPDPVSFAPPGAITTGEATSATWAGLGHGGHGAIPVGPGRPSIGKAGRHAGILDVSGLPIHATKIHRPLLPAQTLSRERLNGWLDVHAAQRIVVIVAEAGFGKTTLLADWSRRTQRRCLWYRLEPDDRDWLGFIRHVVGSGREADDGFMPRTLRLLTDLGPGGPTRDQVIESFVTELASEAHEDPQGITLLLDDYQHIDGGEEVTPIVQALLERTGNGLTVVIASRATPALPLGRFRARGGVARLEGEDLCFALDEAERLFRETYDRPLEPDVLEDLVHRTDGWPAALRLVRSAIEDRTPLETRSFIRDLTGAHAELHDFLAEEVVGSLPTELQQFLMRTSILDAVDPRAVDVVDPPSSVHLAERIERAEHLGLLARPDVDSPHRFHPLVRDFLHARLMAEVGADRVRAMHLDVGRHFEGVEWRISATHYSRGGDQPSVDRVVEQGIDEILGRGEYRIAADLIHLEPGGATGLAQLLLQSRIDLQLGSPDKGFVSASRAVEAADLAGDPRVVAALLNAATIAMAARRYDAVRELSTRAYSAAADASQRDLARALASLVSMSYDGDLLTWSLELNRLLRKQMADGQRHYAAITHLNLAQVCAWLDLPADALRHGTEAQRLLNVSSKGYEGVSVILARGHALAQMGRWEAAESELREALEASHPEAHLEAMLEAAQVYAWYGPEPVARDLLQRIRASGIPDHWAQQWDVVALWLASTPHERDRLRGRLGDLPGASSEVAAGFRWHLTMARSWLEDGSLGSYGDHFAEADRLARLQKSPVQRRLVGLLDAVASSPATLSRAIEALPPNAGPALSVFASEIARVLSQLSAAAQRRVREEAASAPQRWRETLRDLVRHALPASAAAAELLADIGGPDDLELLRGYSKANRGSLRSAVERLNRRVAPRVFVEDLGRVRIQVGGRSINEGAVRRKVLALLCFVIAAPGGSASRDQVMDALWPDLPPDLANNSLNQTIYFLRRVFDPQYRAGTSPEYLRFESELVWLDRELVDCRSWLCRRILAAAPDTEATVEALVGNYQGRWAADFTYEEWAVSYRDNLHAAFIGQVERALSAGGSPARWRLWLAQRALEVDPQADLVEAELIRLYRNLGAHRAASEQYAHYASALRTDLGIEPPPLEDV